MDLKNGGIAAAAAFISSLLIGFISSSTMPFLIVWPLVFAVIFFVLVNAAKFLFSRFLPELLDEENFGSNSLPGSVVNIMEGDNSDFSGYSSDGTQEFDDSSSWQASNGALNAARPDDSEKSIGDIASLSEAVSRNKAAYKGSSESQEISTGIDLDMENGYTSMGDFEKSYQPEPSLESAASGAASNPPANDAVKPARPGSSSSKSSSWYSVSDDTLPDLDSMAGVFANASTEEESETGNYAESSSKKRTASKDKTLEGDFSPKDIAEGIRTVLKKDKEE